MKKFDLHIHSTCSKHKVWGIDGMNTPQEIVEMALRIGLDGIAMTDHNTIRGSEKAIQYVKEKKLELLVIKGAEIRTLKGDILALGISEDITPNMEIIETIDAIKAQGGLAIAAHPFKYNTKIGNLLKSSPNSYKFDGIEVFNSNIRKDANKRALNLINELNLPGIAGSDAHYKKCIGTAITSLKIDDLSVEAALEAILSNKIELSCNYNSLRNTLILYFKKIGHMLKRVVGKSNNTCKDSD